MASFAITRPVVLVATTWPWDMCVLQKWPALASAEGGCCVAVQPLPGLDLHGFDKSVACNTFPVWHSRPQGY
jgi:hypothetical protein